MNQRKHNALLSYRWQAAICLIAGALLAGLWSSLALAQEQPQPDSAAPARVVVNGVESAAFPRVVVRASVVNTDGLPVTGLPATSFLMAEDGIPIASDAISVTERVDQPLNLVLALDRSTDPDSWATIQSVAARLIATLGENDQVGLVAFGDDAQIVLSPTADKTQAQIALATRDQRRRFQRPVRGTGGRVEHFDDDDRRAQRHRSGG